MKLHEVKNAIIRKILKKAINEGYYVAVTRDVSKYSTTHKVAYRITGDPKNDLGLDIFFKIADNRRFTDLDNHGIDFSLKNNALIFFDE